MFRHDPRIIPADIQRQINEAHWDFMAKTVADAVATYGEYATSKGHERVNVVATGQTACLVDMVNAKTLVRIQGTCFMDEITIDVQSNIGHPQNFKGIPS